jgi:peroxiredoxin
MPIKVGDRLPEVKFRVMTTEGPVWKTTDDVFKGRKVALFAVPGAFTPTCNNLHIPSFLNNAAAIKAKGVHTIAVTGVNDVFVMEAWKKSTGAEGKIDFLADGNGEFAKAIDMAFDGSGNGLGTRSKRYSMLVEDGVVKKLNIARPESTILSSLRRSHRHAPRPDLHAQVRPHARSSRDRHGL